ncbi:MAG: hypothetical protein KAH30_03755 [Caldisericia bacterium]|nr:hypothetical protein [Caldisericia bacterium]
MKRKITVITLLLVVLLLSVSVVSASIQLKPGSANIKIDGLPCKLNQAIPNIDGTSMVPTRLLLIEGDLNLEVESGWQVFYSKSGVALLKVKADSQNAIDFSGKKIELVKPAYIQAGNLHVPAKQVAELLGMKVDWNAKDKNFPLTLTKKVVTKKDASWADSLISGIGSELFFFLALGLILFFAIAFFVLTPLKRRWWGQE